MRKLTLIPFFFLLVYAIPSYARNYHIELVVFEREPKAGELTEKWDFSSDRIAANKLKIKELEEKIDTELVFSENLNYLSQIRQELVASGYQILRTARWQQPSSVYQNAPLVSLGEIDTHLTAGYIRVYKTSLIFADVDLQLSPSVFDSESILIEDQSIANTIEEQQVLSDHLYETSLNSQSSQLNAIKTPQYFISEKRRLKFKEIHYLDHPHFGMILGVWPVETTETE